MDDLLQFTSDDSLSIKLQDELSSIFELTNMGGFSKVIKIEISQGDNSITISQKQYPLSILQKEGMDKANPVSMPLDPNVRLEPNLEEHEDSGQQNAHMLLLGSLQYLSTTTRLDIMFAINQLAAYTSNPGLSHYMALKRVLRYLKGTIEPK